MRNLYQIHRYRGFGFSIDRVNKSGEYINQVAYYFRTRREAKKRLAEIIAEDNNGEPTPISAEWGTVNK